MKNHKKIVDLLLEKNIDIDIVANDAQYQSADKHYAFSLTVKDFKCLDNNNYINDSIIDFYLK